MICPKCGMNDQQKIISTRRRSSDYILRRRECICGHRFNSVEITELNEKNMKAIQREMNHNCKKRAFEKIIYDKYLYLFDRNRYMQQAGKRGEDS